MPGWLDEAARVLGGGAGLGAGLGGVFFALKWVFEFIGGRMDRRADRLDSDTRFIIENLREEVGRVAKRLSAAEIEIVDLKGQLAECQHEHAVARHERDHLKAVLLATSPGMKMAFPLDQSIPKDMAVLAVEIDAAVAAEALKKGQADELC
ncbi:hypothetical protein [Novosphingobium olei]|uniref:hypothetical protein n=1 Tax=Novosphingobium olei TaxID=2728851 RepID=UPI00308EDD29|nr:hypothetical protein NSDW_11540 [Novosphingobium olei]